MTAEELETVRVQLAESSDAEHLWQMAERACVQALVNIDKHHPALERLERARTRYLDARAALMANPNAGVKR